MISLATWITESIANKEELHTIESFLDDQIKPSREITTDEPSDNEPASIMRTEPKKY